MAMTIVGIVLILATLLVVFSKRDSLFTKPSKDEYEDDMIDDD